MFRECSLRHGLVDGLNPVAHGKLVHDFLMHLFKVNLPRIVSLSNRDFDHAPSLNVGREVKDVLWRNIKRQQRSRQPWKRCLLAFWCARVTSWRHVYCTWYGAPFSSPSISTLIWRRMAPDTADLSVLFSVRQETHIVDRPWWRMKHLRQTTTHRPLCFADIIGKWE